MSARARNAARRLACYLHAIGVSPSLTEESYKKDYQQLHAQYSALPELVRREARCRGRRIIREIGLEAAAAVIPYSLSRTLHSTKDNALQLARLLRKSQGRCRSCKTWGHGKRSWPSHPVAEQFRPYSGDMSLSVYECPIYPGTFHLGHRGAGPNKEQPSDQ